MVVAPPFGVVGALGIARRPDGKMSLIARWGGARGGPMSSVSEKESRQVAEAAREQEWTKPSFGKELFLGHLPARPHPSPPATHRRAAAQGGRLRRRSLEAFVKEVVDPIQIERDAKIPDHVIKGLCDIGALGMKIDEKYGGLGLSYLYYNRALEAGRPRPTPLSARCSVPTSRSEFPSRSSCSAPRSRRSASCRAWPPTRSAPSC